MSYLQKTAQKRCRPIEILPGTKTIIALAASYADRNEPVTTHKTTPNPGGSSPGSHLQPVGVVARYARFRDYHLVLREKLAALAEHINRLGGPGTRSVGYVDTGPILERDLAQRAGIGFFGKHNNLISRKLGNWF
ncbi:MAG: DUF1730 domain-containing protein, partial [Verrucomicrobiae bacterium]|nr:DUF1730 domain-containing protein [Verrucomicrobiae bacterium]